MRLRQRPSRLRRCETWFAASSRKRVSGRECTEQPRRHSGTVSANPMDCGRMNSCACWRNQTRWGPAPSSGILTMCTRTTQRWKLICSRVAMSAIRSQACTTTTVRAFSPARSVTMTICIRRWRRKSQHLKTGGSNGSWISPVRLAG